MSKQVNSFLGKIKSDFKKIILGNVIINGLFLIFGVMIFFNAKITLEVAGVITGIYFVIFGLYGIFEFSLRNRLPIFKKNIFVGILEIILGIFMMFNPFKIIKIITFALGIYLIIIALGKLYESIRFKKYGFDGWLIMLVTSLLLLAFGIFIAINPMASMDLAQAAGIFIILSSILEICNLIMILSRAKEIEKLLKKD